MTYQRSRLDWPISSSSILGETFVVNDSILLGSARLFNIRARTLLVLTLEMPTKKARDYLLSQFYGRIEWS